MSQRIIPTNIVNKTANESFDSHGNKIEAGDKKLRWQTSADERCHFAARESLDEIFSSNGISFSAILQRFTYTKAKIGDKAIYVNISSVGKRLHISRDVVKDLSPEMLGALLDDKAKSVSEVLKQYDQFIAKPNFTSFSNNPSILFKIINLSTRYLVDDYSSFFNVEGHKFVAKKVEDELKLFFISEFLGSGTYSNVYNAIEFKSGEVYAFKLIKSVDELQPQYNSEIDNSVKIRVKLGPMDGAQPLPIHGVKVYNDKTNQVQHGFMEVIANGNLEDSKEFNSKTLSEKLKLWLDPLRVIAHTEDCNIAHSDIKLENFLVYEKQSGGLQVALADFGGAKQLEVLDQIEEIPDQDLRIVTLKRMTNFHRILGAHTPDYVHYAFILAGQKAFAEGNIARGF